MRRVLKILGWLLAGMLFSAATLPWWMGGVLALAKRPLGFEYGSYDRVGYARFALRDARYRYADVVVTMGRVEAATPLLFGWRHLRGKPSPLFVNDWRVEVKRGKPSPRDPDAGWVALRSLLLRITDAVGLWLPEARVESGEVVFPGGRIGLGLGNWRDRVLGVEGLSWGGHAYHGAVEFVSREDLIRLRLATEKDAARVALESRGTKVAGSAQLLEQTAAIDARFAERGWLPFEAQVVAEKWSIDGPKLRLGTAYAAVLGTGRIDWRKDSFTVDMTATGVPLAGEKTPPLEVVAHGRGDLDTLTIETLHAAIPGLKADLSEPVRMNREGQLLSGPSRFILEADLARQSWFSAEGQVKGEARIDTGRDFKPRITVQVSAKALKVGRWSASQLQAAGVFDWPMVEVSSANVDLGKDESIQLSGTMNLETKEVSASKLEAKLNGATVAGWWPGLPIFTSSVVVAQFEGPWAQLKHGGKVQISGLNQPPLRVVEVKLEWAGVGDAVEQATVAATNGEAQIFVTGAADRNGAKIDELRIQKLATTWLALEKPARIDWQPELRCESLVLTGDAGKIELAVRTGKAGEARLQVKDFATAWLRDWLLWLGPDWRIPAVDFSGQWDNGPMTFTLSATADTDLAEQRPVEVQLKATGGRAGVKLEVLKVFEGQQEAISASGALPVMITPAAQALWSFDTKASLEISAATRPDAAFWTYLAETSGLLIERPQMNLELSGNRQSPRGKIVLQLPRIAANPLRFKRKLPVAEAIDGVIELDRGEITLRKLSATVAGQQVQMEGKIPVPKGGLSVLREMSWKQLLQQATGRLQLPRADLAALAPYVSVLIAPKGELDVDITLAEGKAHGFVRVDNAGTRPLGPLGVLQELKADLALAGRNLEIRTLEAKMAGQLVTVKGSAELGEDGVPRFDFSLKGENLPFVRQVGLLLRGDLDLKLVSNDAGASKIMGKVKLRESLFSTDVRDLVPKGGGNVGAAARPPFFSVEAPPFNAWQLDVDLSGERFLRLRTPVFNGLASMRFHLADTLGEPRATGQAVIEQGQVLLPFATFAIQQGSIQLTEANPYEPALLVTGTSRRYGYDLRMEVSGTASLPVLTFSSSPPLNSEQVLLLVMAGETPNSEMSYSGNQRAVRFGAFIGKSLFSSVSSDSSAGDRLTLSTGEKVSRQGRETYEAEYTLGKRWSLVGEYDEFDDYNTGLKWRVLTDKRKEKKPDAK